MTWPTPCRPASSVTACYGSFPAGRIDPEIYFDPLARPGDARISSRQGGTIADADARGAGVTRAWLLDVLDRALVSARLSKAATAGQAAPIFLAHSRGGGSSLYDAALLAAAVDLLLGLIAGAHPDEFDRADIEAIVAAAKGSLAASLQPGQSSARCSASPEQNPAHSNCSQDFRVGEGRHFACLCCPKQPSL